MRLVRCPKAIVIEANPELQLMNDVLICIEGKYLPFSGGWLEQPELFARTYELICSWLEEAKNDGT